MYLSLSLHSHNVVDGKHPCLTLATHAGKILIHCPHSKDEKGISIHISSFTRLVKYLNINRTITALCAGALKPNSKNDILFIGTGTNLLAYDSHSIPNV